MMDFFYFAYYQLQRWAEKREKNFPVVLVLTWMTVISIYHVYTLLSLVTIVFRIDAGIPIPASNLGKLAFLIVWASLVWVGLTVCGIKKKAFSPERVARYKRKGFKAWWLIVYIFLSFALMAVTTWFAGAVLRSQGPRP